MNLTKELNSLIDNCTKYLEKNIEDNFELEGLNLHDAVELKNKHFKNYNVKIVSYFENPLFLSPFTYKLNSKLIISNKLGVFQNA